MNQRLGRYSVTVVNRRPDAPEDDPFREMGVGRFTRLDRAKQIAHNALRNSEYAVAAYVEDMQHEECQTVYYVDDLDAIPSG